MAAMLLLKVSLLMTATLLGAWLLRASSPLTRHRYWSVAFCAVLALPALQLFMPAVMVPVPAGWNAAASLPLVRPVDEAVVEQVAVAGGSSSRDGGQRPRVAERAEPPATVGFGLSPRAAILSAWVIGTCFAIAALLLSLLRVQRLANTAIDMDDSAWGPAARAIGARLGCRRPVRLLVAEQITAPMAGGVWRPTVFLPLAARAWTPGHRDVVLAHEIAHLASGDPLRHLVTRLALAVYWFHPLAWIAARHAARAREDACDAAVLSLGTRPSAYARVLLDLAESMEPRSRWLTALPMVHRSHLETRLMTILQDTRPVLSRLAAIPPVVVAVLTLAVAAAQPGAAAPQRPFEFERQPAGAAPPAAMATVALARLQSSPVRDCRGTGSQISSRESDRIVEQSFGDLHLCLVAGDVGDRLGATLPSAWLGAASRFTMEARRGTTVQQLENERRSDGSRRVSWRVDGRERPFDSSAEQWRDRMLAIFDATWELAQLHGQVSSLRGEISSIRGEQSSLHGEISSLRGQVSSMRGRISSLRGEESSLHGQISSIRGQVSSLRGAISSEQGAISSLNSERYRADDAARARINVGIAQHEATIARLERDLRAYDADTRIAAVERELASFDTDREVRSIEAEIDAFDLDSRVADIERRIAALDVEGRVADIERQLAGLDSDRRGRQIEDRRAAALPRLDAAIAAIR